MGERFYHERVGFFSPTTDAGDLAIGSRIGASFLLPSETGITNGKSPFLLIQEGDDFEIVDATYVASPEKFTLDTVLVSKIGATIGTTKMDLNGGAEVRFLGPTSSDLKKLFIRGDIDQSTLLSAVQKAQARTNILAEALGKTAAPNAQTDNYTLALTDAGKTVKVTAATAKSVTVPPQASVAWEDNTYINLEAWGAGQVSIAKGSGVEVYSRNGLKLAGQYAVASLRRDAANVWIACGDLTS